MIEITSIPPNRCLLVFTDLDGSLLDHYSYSYQEALPQICLLERLGIPLIPVTSKTRAEVEHLRTQLPDPAPFIVENGAAVFIPVGYFSHQPNATVERDGYWVHEIPASRDRWLKLLNELYEEFPGEYDFFFRAGTEGVISMTGLPEARALEANQREYSEPVKWLGDDRRRDEFIRVLHSNGAHVLQGGRFLSVSGECDKGKALAWLRQVYRDFNPNRLVHDLAIGDSGNDCAMLEVASTALVVRSPVHDYPQLSRTDGVMYSTDYGPAGWAEAVARWLESQQQSD